MSTRTVLSRSAWSAVACLTLFALTTVVAMRTVSAACSLSWPGELTCKVAVDTPGNSGDFDIQTDWSSNGKGEWTFITIPRDSISDGLEDESPITSPGGHTVDDGGTYAGGIVTNTCSAKLADGGIEGEYQLNALDTTDFECSGAHETTIKPNTGSCP